MIDRRYRLLVVADRPEDREWLRRAFAHRDANRFEVVEVGLGAQGLAHCRATPPDCVLVSDQLPDMDALAFLTSLKDGHPESPVPVVVLTARGDEALAAQAMKAGAHDYLAHGAYEAEVHRTVWKAVERQTRPLQGTYRVLIIDDSPEDRELYRRRLGRGAEQFEFREAETGAEGIALCGEFHPDCVLLDYQLPDADGIEVLTRLLHECGEGLAVLMLTGHGSESVAVRALKAGAEDYLIKGSGLESLPQAVRTAVEKVTLRYRLEEQRRELARSRNQLRVTLASIGDAVIATDPAAKVTFLNPEAERLTGWRSDEARDLPLDQIFPIVNEETRQPADNPALRSLREGTIVGLANHTVLVSKDGTERPIDDSAAPIRDEAGDVFGAVLVFRDVTERRRTEQSLLLQSRVLDSMTEGVSVTDENGIIFYTNPAEDQMFGYERGELLGKHVTIQNAYSPEENQRRVNEVVTHLKQRGIWTGEWLNRRKDGSTFISYARISTLQAADRPCFVCVQEDVTERKQLEDELQRRITELALTDRRKDEFLAMLAHELRNPLAPIKNSLHILRLKHSDWKTVDQVREMMERQVGHLTRLVDDLLDVSRITQGKVTLKLERLDLARLARESATDHQSEFAKGRVTLAAEIPDPPLWVTGDATRLTQVIDNFLNNSLKFTNPGGEVVVSLRAEEGRARLSIRDNGIGIEPGVLPTIFDVFAQADKSLDRTRGGLGLGLAIVKGLIELHGGSVMAQSEGLGRGTEMIVSLPLEQELPALAPAARPRRGPGKHRRVLIIEDNRDSAESLRLLLEVSGYEVRIASAGNEGVRLATEWLPDAIICDIGLPEMDGFAVARKLRATPATTGIRLIAVTGYGREEDIARAHEAGFNDHLVKPADPEKLLEKLH